MVGYWLDQRCTNVGHFANEYAPLSTLGQRVMGCESADNWQLWSTSTIAIVIITQPISWYSFHHPTEGRKLSRPRHCNKGAQPVPKTVYRSSCCDKHNCPRRDSNLGSLTRQSDALTTRLLSWCLLHWSRSSGPAAACSAGVSFWRQSSDTMNSAPCRALLSCAGKNDSCVLQAQRNSARRACERPFRCYWQHCAQPKRRHN